LTSSTLGFARPAAGDALSDARAKAAAIEAQLSQAQGEMTALSEQYDAAVYHLSQIKANIATTKNAIAADQRQVAHDRKTLSKAAIANYITDGTASVQNPLFAGNDRLSEATTEYNKIATGDITLAVAKLHTAEDALNAQQAQLTNEQSQAQTQVAAEQNAVAQNQQAIAQQKDALSQEQGQIATLVQQQQQAEAAAAAKAAAQRIAAAQAAAAAQSAAASSPHPGPSQPVSSGGSAPVGTSQPAPPPTAPGGAGAVQAAESQICVPYVWGAESPLGSPSPGFDCSGLTAWSWGQVGVSLPHYSGAQMADTTPVPLSDLQPGDLLFWGSGGSDHVAMYVGSNELIMAPHTGTTVQIVPLYLGSNFVGAGRP
jgi:cell wall-associated NlpC family hydrolase